MYDIRDGSLLKTDFRFYRFFEESWIGELRVDSGIGIDLVQRL